MNYLIPWTLWLMIAGHAPAQDRVELPKDLDAQIAVAMQSNPEVLMAQAKVLEAEAAYRETRLRITQEVMRAHNDIEAYRMQLQQAYAEFEQIHKLRDQGMVSESEVMSAETAIIQHQNELGQLDAQLQYLLGIDPGAPLTRGPDAAQPTGSPRLTGRPPLSDEAEAWLNRPLKASFVNCPLTEVLPMLRHLLGPTQSVVVSEPTLEALGMPLDELLINWETEEETPLRNLLGAIADVHGLCFVIRDYGILITLEEQAQALYAPVIPPEIPLSPSVLQSETK